LRGKVSIPFSSGQGRQAAKTVKGKNKIVKGKVSIPFSSGQGRQGRAPLSRKSLQKFGFPSPFHRVKEGKIMNKFRIEEAHRVAVSIPFSSGQGRQVKDAQAEFQNLRRKVSIPFSSGQGRQVSTKRAVLRRGKFPFPSPFHRVKEGKEAVTEFRNLRRKSAEFPSPFHRVKEGKTYYKWNRISMTHLIVSIPFSSGQGRQVLTTMAEAHKEIENVSIPFSSGQGRQVCHSIHSSHGTAKLHVSIPFSSGQGRQVFGKVFL